MARFLIKPLGLEAVVFDKASGDTHYLSPLAQAVYAACLEQPGGPAEKVCLLAAEHLGVPPEDIPYADAREVIAHLQRIGLVDTQ